MRSGHPTGSLRVTRFVILVAVAALPTSVPGALAQDASPVRVSGSVGVTARGYQANGIDDRRAPTAIEANANTDFALFGLSSGIRVTYSTDQSGLRQSVNRLAFQTEWSRGRIAAGDVSPDYTAFSMRGSTVRGGLIEVRPGPLFFGVSGGRSRRAVSLGSGFDPRGSVFERWVGSARVGVGSAEGTHFHVIGVYGKDVQSSLSDPGPLRPHANISLTPDIAVSAFQRRLRIRASATASAVSRDSETGNLRIEHLALSRSPDIRSTWAAEFDGGFNGRQFGLQGSFQRVMPGFESFGLGQVRSDEQTIRVAPRLTIGNGTANVTASVSRAQTNLLGDQLTTSFRDQATATVAIRAGQRVTFAVNYTGISNRVEAVSGAPIEFAEQKQVGHNVVFAPVLIVGSPTGVMQTFSVSVSWQTFNDRSPDVLDGSREGFESTNQSLMLTHAARLTTALSTTLSGGIVQSNASMSESTVKTANLGLSWRVSRALTTSVGGGWARNEQTTAGAVDIAPIRADRLTASTGLAWTVTNADAVRLDVRGSRNDMGGDSQDFSEVTATLAYTHRF